MEGVAAGMHALLRLPDGVDDAAVAAAAEAEGVRVTPLSRCGGGTGLVLGYGRIHEDALPHAVRALACAVMRQPT